MPAMPLTPCWPPPVITSISCLDGWSACCLDSWRLKMPRSPFNGSENRKLHGRRHDCGQKARVKTILLIETDMLRAVGEGEQSDMPRFPRVELLHSPGEQCLGNATLLQIRSHGERTKETNAAPLCGKIRA